MFAMILLVFAVVVVSSADTTSGRLVTNAASASLVSYAEAGQTMCPECTPCSTIPQVTQPALAPLPSPPNAFTPLGDTLFGTSGYPHVCVCVRTSANDVQGYALFTLLQSLITQKFQTLDVFLVDTDTGNATQRRGLLYKVIAQVGDKRVHLSR